MSWKESGRGDRWAEYLRKARGRATPTEWHAQTGITRQRWGRYEEGVPPQSLDHFWEVADVLGVSPQALIDIIEGHPAAPQGQTLAELAENFTDVDFDQLCQLKDGDTLVRWIAIASRVLSSRITEDKPGSPP